MKYIFIGKKLFFLWYNYVNKKKNANIPSNWNY